MEQHPDYNAAFKKAYAGLNAAQKEAVDAIEGPVMVVAGPGTGKTQILSVRIGNILQQTDTQPENILCLTYTDAGTIAMRRRLLTFIGPDAYRVQIQTFHAFCNEVIQSHPHLFGKRDLDLISDLENIELLEQLLLQLPPQHILRKFKGDLSFDIGKLNNLFRQMKEEDWTVEVISHAVDSYIADLPTRDEYIYKKGSPKKGIKAGDLKQAAIDKETERMEKLRAGAALYPIMQEKMRELGRYDYSDMILWVLKAFQTNEDLLRTYQERYQYVLVDEYQDTNGSQNEILQLLINFWDVPNVFVVGDDDQSIYEFQGARVQNILDFYNKYAAHIKTVVLTDNYRSVQQVLDAAKAVIDRNNDRLIRHIEGLSKELFSSNPALSALDSQPEVHVYPDLLQENAGILESIKRALQEGLPPTEIAVIYHRHAQAEDLALLFEKAGLPYTMRKKINALDHPFIRQILQILVYVSEEFGQPNSAQHLLFELLYYPYFNIRKYDIVSIAAYIQSKRGPLTWRMVMSDENLAREVRLKDPEQLQQLDGLLATWIGEVASLTLPMLLEKILNEGGILRYIAAHEEKLFLLELVNTLFDFVKQEAARKPSMRVQDLMDVFHQMQTHGIQLPVVRTNGLEGGVQFVTCHSAKGLEFDTVFLMGLTRNKWESARGNNYQFKYPDTLTKSAATNEIEALRRLFYVAITRAKKHLFLSYAAAGNDGKEQEPSLFIAEVMESGVVASRDVELEEAAIEQTRFALLTTSQPMDIPMLEEAYLKTRTEHFVLSASSLNTYLKCPVTFYFQQILRVPQAKSDSMQFGTAIHDALQRLFAKMKDNHQQFPSAEELVRDFTFYMHQHREAFTDQQFKNRLEYGQLILPEYYNHYIGTWNKVVTTEYPIRNVTIEGIPLTGKLDKLEFDGNEVVVVDYKTGNIKYAKDKLERPGEKMEHGGDYWRQMVFYQLLMDLQRQKNWKMVKGEFDFVEKNAETNAFEKAVVVVSEEDKAIVVEQIRTVYASIREHQFANGCSEEDCYYCNLVKN